MREFWIWLNCTRVIISTCPMIKGKKRKEEGKSKSNNKTMHMLLFIVPLLLLMRAYIFSLNFGSFSLDSHFIWWCYFKRLKSNKEEFHAHDILQQQASVSSLMPTSISTCSNFNMQRWSGATRRVFLKQSSVGHSKEHCSYWHVPHLGELGFKVSSFLEWS